MSREILFRGKRINNGEWVYGYLARFRNFANEVYTSIIQINDYETQECSIQDNTCVIPETVGQFTGLVDKNGKNIFEGDICRVAYLGSRCDSNGKHYPVENVTIKEVVFEKGTFCFKTIIEYITIYRPIGFDTHGKPKTKYYEVIGNIHDNSELLEV